MILSGGFGAGKSHVLEYLAQRALRNKFICSKITINKETPLHDPIKLFGAAVESSVAPGRVGNGLREAISALPRTGAAVSDLQEWVTRSGLQLDGRFAPSLSVFLSSRADSEVRDRILQFWLGEPLWLPTLRNVLSDLEIAWQRDIPMARNRDLARQRFQFVNRLVRAAGFKGWVLLVDEAELVGCYTVLQRAKAYAELARLVGPSQVSQTSGIASVFAITDDFAAAVLDGKKDFTNIPILFRTRGRDYEKELAASALSGMKLIRAEAVPVTSPGDAELSALYAKLKRHYGVAYGVVPTEVTGPERRSTTRMRHYVKRWITEWDMKRLYPSDDVHVEELTVKTDYSEDPLINELLDQLL